MRRSSTNPTPGSTNERQVKIMCGGKASNGTEGNEPSPLADHLPYNLRIPRVDTAVTGCDHGHAPMHVTVLMGAATIAAVTTGTSSALGEMKMMKMKMPGPVGVSQVLRTSMTISLPGAGTTWKTPVVKTLRRGTGDMKRRMFEALH